MKKDMLYHQREIAKSLAMWPSPECSRADISIAITIIFFLLLMLHFNLEKIIADTVITQNNMLGNEPFVTSH